MTAGFKSPARNWLASVVALLVSLTLAVAGLVAIPAGHAVEAETETGSASITFEYPHGDGVGVDVELHRVATWDKDWNAQPTEAFKDASVTWPELGKASAEDLRKLAATLAGYIVQNGEIEPMKQGETGADGTITFDKLPDGLYLIVFGSYANGDLTCEGGAQLVSLPTSTDKAGTVEGVTVKAEAKSDCEVTPPTPPEEPKEDITVIKVWEDDNDADHKRPGKIVAQLFKDGVLYDEVELNESNGWKHTWTDLDKDHEWTVVEKTVPEGYTTSTDREGTTITIINKHEPGEDKNPPDDKDHDDKNPPVVTPPDHTAKTGAAVTGAVLIAAALLGVGGIMLRRARKAL